MNSTTQAERSKHVAQMRANFAIENMHPDADDLNMQQRYIDGTASIDDLLQYARTYAESKRG
jgi:hypothetical protein